MKDTHRSNTLLLELLIVILFFMLALTTIVEIFANARIQSRRATARTEAITMVQNLADEVYLAEDPKQVFSAYGLAEENGKWSYDEGHFVLTVEQNDEQYEAGNLRRMTYSVTYLGEELFSVPCDRYIPEVSQP